MQRLVEALELADDESASRVDGGAVKGDRVGEADPLHDGRGRQRRAEAGKDDRAHDLTGPVRC